MVFLDTSFIISLINKKDRNHKRAREVMNNINSNNYGNICISDYVFSECANVILKILNNLKTTEEICTKLKKDVVFFMNQDLFEETWNIFIKQKNNRLGFIDCSILAVMEKNSIKYLATFDKDFENIEGIKVLN